MEQRNLFFRSIFLKIINCFVTAIDHQCSQTLFCLCSGSKWEILRGKDLLQTNLLPH